MANTAQTQKRVRQALKKNLKNSSQRSMLRTAIKAVYKVIKTNNKNVILSVFRSSISVIDRIANKNIIHKNKAARQKSRLFAVLKLSMEKKVS